MQAMQSRKGSTQTELLNMFAEKSTNKNKDTNENTSEDTNLASLLRNVIDALTQRDAERLQHLSLSIEVTSLPTGSVSAEVRYLHRLLGALLQESQRNLRVWQRAAGRHSRESYCRQSYGPFYR